MGSICILIGFIYGALPALVGNDLDSGSDRFEQQSSQAAVHMAEPALAEMPDQHGNRILAALQIGRDLDRIVIGVVWGRPPFQSAFEDD